MKIVYEQGSGEIVEKKSRFISNVMSVNSEEQAAEYIQTLKKKYYDARHNCYAYVIGDKNEIQKYSDDGEPQGTAGRPIMDIIIKEEIHNCLIVVTRYFGGTLLGTGGLIRAYQASSKDGIDNAQIVDVIKGIRAGLTTDYNNVGKLQYIAAEAGINIADTQYTDKVKMEFLINEDEYVQFAHRIEDEFNGRLMLEIIKKQNFCKNASNEVFIFN